MSDGIAQLVKAKLAMLEVYEAVINTGTWVTWPDGNQYFVIKPQDFRRLLDPYDVVSDAEEGLRKEWDRKAESLREKASFVSLADPEPSDMRFPARLR